MFSIFSLFLLSLSCTLCFSFMLWFYCFCFFFFFQAEDGIRDHCVTGVQTCALPIWGPPQFDGTVVPRWTPPVYADRRRAWTGAFPDRPDVPLRVEAGTYQGRLVHFQRSEERRVGKECRSRWARYNDKKKQ